MYVGKEGTYGTNYPKITKKHRARKANSASVRKAFSVCTARKKEKYAVSYNPSERHFIILYNCILKTLWPFM